ncbi:TorD/DmsD family molecular chaperone [Neobacillus sp. LXY-1]|uniref:TorD/DmsD family molecular chaperone n=1 Tax=Neobacillus sp. LXY-1 TaxID=3379133 RepID=UPI003EE18083
MNIFTESVYGQLQSYMLSRKNFYQILHILFSEPDKEEIFFQLSIYGNFGMLGEFHEGGKILDQFFKTLTLEQLMFEREEYQRLFIGPGPLVAPPWESYYRSKEHLVFEEWTFQVREKYRTFGLQYVKENNEPDDHLLLELEFMIYLSSLCQSEINLNQITDIIQCQIDFLEQHLLFWVPDFCKRIIGNTTSTLYLGVSMLLEDFISDDLTSLKEIKEVLADV